MQDASCLIFYNTMLRISNSPSFGKGMKHSKTPRIRQLEALVSVISNGSMTSAAADMGISQPAISRLLSDLAKDFDFQLFNKRDGQL